MVTRKETKNNLDWCEERINRIVYQLYGLTEEEIRIVMGSKQLFTLLCHFD